MLTLVLRELVMIWKRNLLVGTVNGTPTWEDGLAVSRKTKHNLIV